MRWAGQFWHIGPALPALTRTSHVSQGLAWLRGAALLSSVLLASGCLSQARRAAHTDEVLLTHYRQAPIAGASREQLDALLDTLPVGVPLCLSVRTPCVSEPDIAQGPARRFCLRWGESSTCFIAEQVPAGLSVRVEPEQEVWSPTHRWLVEALDPNFQALRSEAQAQADEAVATSEERPVAANSFWAQLRGVGVWPTFGLQVQGGYRRWLSQYVLASAGAGYERGLISFAGERLRRDALLLTARLELSSYDALGKGRWLSLPALAGHFGVTAVIGVSPDSGWGMRSFVGFSCIVPLSLELGAAFERFPNSTAAGARFYLAAGLGL